MGLQFIVDRQTVRTVCHTESQLSSISKQAHMHLATYATRCCTVMYCTSFIITSYTSEVRAQEASGRTTISDAAQVQVPMDINEMLAKWDAYHDFTKKLQGNIKFTHTNDGKLIQDRVYEIRRNDRCGLCIDQDMTKGGRAGRLYAFNPDYSFRLNKQKPDALWTIVSRSENSAGAYSADKAKVESLMSNSSVLMSVSGTALRDLVRSPTYKLVSVTRTNRRKVDLIKLVFVNPHPVEKATERFVPAQGGIVYLDPANQWCIREYEVDEKWLNINMKVNRINEVSLISEGMPVPTSTVDEGLGTEVGNSTQFQNTYKWAFDLATSETPRDDKDFRLSAFGLPEPGGERLRRRSNATIYIAVGAVCMCISLVAYLYRRRRRVAPWSAVA